MAPPKTFPKGVLPAKGSFGGHNQPGASCSSTHHSLVSESAMSSLSSVSAKMALQDEEFPPLDKEGTSSAVLPAKSRVNSQRGGSSNPLGGPSPRTRTQDVPSMSSIPWGIAASSRNIHYGADKDDDWVVGADEEDALSHSRSKKKVAVRRQPPGGAGERNTASQDRIYHLGWPLLCTVITKIVNDNRSDWDQKLHSVLLYSTGTRWFCHLGHGCPWGMPICGSCRWTSILRHRAVDYKLEVRNDGYVVVSDLLKLAIRTRAGIPLSAYTVDDILKAVERDNKQRFTLLTENDVLLIRANQGHSIKTIETEKLLKPILSAEEIPVCVHGTLMGNLDSILKTGLKKMGRNHVHFASGLPREDGVISGMRHTSEVLIYLDAKKALLDGMKLYMSDNGVILTEGFNGLVPPQYFAKIGRWRNGKITILPFDAKTGSM